MSSDGFGYMKLGVRTSLHFVLPNFDDFSKWNKLQNLEKGRKVRPKIPNYLYPDSSLRMTLKTAKIPPINTIELVLYTYIST